VFKYLEIECVKLALNGQKVKVTTYIRTICRVSVFIQLVLTYDTSGFTPGFFVRSVYVGHLFVFPCCVVYKNPTPRVDLVLNKMYIIIISSKCNLFLP